MKKLILLSAIIGLIFTSCDKKNLPDVGGTSAEKMANEWWVTFTDQGGSDVFSLGHQKIATYNSSGNGDTLWVDDLGDTWQFKVKTQANFNDLTFNTAGSQNEYYNISVKITDGKVFPGLGRSKSGNVTDSIMMHAEFSDDPGTIYTLAGHARTRFAEDDY